MHTYQLVSYTKARNGQTIRYEEVLEKVKKHTGPIGFDTETSGAQVLVANTTKPNPYTSFLVGFSFSLGEEENYYAAVCHKSKQDCLKEEHSDELLRAVLSKDEIWAHNWKYDNEIMRAYFCGEQVYSESVCRDSLISAWLSGTFKNSLSLKALQADYLGIEADTYAATVGSKTFYEITPKQGLKYAAQDAWATLKLGTIHKSKLVKMELWDTYLSLEMPFVFVLGDMQYNGMRLDSDRLLSLAKKLRGESDALLAKWYELIGSTAHSISSPKTVEYLYGAGIWDESVAERTTKTKTPAGCSTSMENQMKKLKKDSVGYQLAEVKLAYQEAYKVYSTYTTSLVRAQNQYPDKRIHADFNHTGTVTGRLSSAKPNLQNIPVRSPAGQRMKECFIPAKGHVFLSADYSQIELRHMAHMAGGKGNLAKAYFEDIDIHQMTADLIESTRNEGKTINFAVNYGMGDAKLAKSLGITVAKAKLFNLKYKEGYPEVTRLRDRAIQLGQQRGYVKTISGRRVMTPDLVLSKTDSRRWTAERKAFNAVIQGGAADLMKMAMVKFRKWIIEKGYQERCKIVAVVHDELCCEVEDTPEFKEECKLAMQHCMEKVYPGYKVPLVAEPSFGYTWLECK